MDTQTIQLGWLRLIHQMRNGRESYISRQSAGEKMNEKSNDRALRTVKNYKKRGFLAIALCVLACKVPLLIVLVGLGGLSTIATVIQMPPMIQTIGLTVGILGFVSLAGYLVYRALAKVRT